MPRSKALHIASKKSQPDSENDVIQKVFQDCQNSVACHRKYIVLMSRIIVDQIDKQQTGNDENKDPNVSFTSGMGAVEAFQQCLYRVLLVFKRDPAVERLVQFLIQLLTFSPKPKEDSGDEAIAKIWLNFSQLVLEQLLTLSGSEEKAVRFRSCQLIGGVLNAFGEHFEIEPALWKKLHSALLPRLSDKVPVIRVMAVIAVQRLQGPDEVELTSQLLHMMRCDPSKEVRRTVLEQFEIFDTKPLPDILARTKDIKPEVRAAAFDFLERKVDVRFLRKGNCMASLVEWGLGDRETSVKKACTNMILNQWMKTETVKGNPIKLLQYIGVEANEKVAEKMVMAILDNYKQNSASRRSSFGGNQACCFPEGKADLTELTHESALYLRVQCDFIGKNFKDVADKEEMMEKILPDMVMFCQTVEKFLADVDEVFITTQLLKIVRMVGFLEEASRRELLRLLRAQLTDPETSSELVEPGMRALAGAFQGSSAQADYNMVVAEIISEITDPIDKMTNPELSIKSSTFIDQSTLLDQTGLDVTLKSQDMEESNANEAVSVKKEEASTDDCGDEFEDSIQKQKKEAEEAEEKLLRQLRSMELISILLENTNRTLTDPILASLQDNILEGIQSPEELIREVAVGCLGRYCLLGRSASRRHRALFLSIAANESEELAIRCVALQALTDTMLLFEDPAAAALEENLTETKLTLPRILEEMLEHHRRYHPAVIAVASECCAKLLFSGKLTEQESPKLVACLLAIYFIPHSAADPKCLQQDEDDPSSDGEALPDEEAQKRMTALGSPLRLQQMLSVFFPSYAAYSQVNREILRRCAKPLLVELTTACLDPHRAGDDVPLNNAVKYLAYLLAQGENSKQQPSSSSEKSGEMKQAGIETIAEEDSNEDEDSSNPQEDAQSDPEEDKEKETDKSKVNGEESEEFGPADVGHLALTLLDEVLRIAPLKRVKGKAKVMQQLCRALALFPPPKSQTKLQQDSGQQLVKLLRALCQHATKQPGVDRVSDRLLRKYEDQCKHLDYTPLEPVDTGARLWKSTCIDELASIIERLSISDPEEDSLLESDGSQVSSVQDSPEDHPPPRRSRPTRQSARSASSKIRASLAPVKIESDSEEEEEEEEDGSSQDGDCEEEEAEFLPVKLEHDSESVDSSQENNEKKCHSVPVVKLEHASEDENDGDESTFDGPEESNAEFEVSEAADQSFDPEDNEDSNKENDESTIENASDPHPENDVSRGNAAIPYLSHLEEEPCPEKGSSRVSLGRIEEGTVQSLIQKFSKSGGKKKQKQNDCSQQEAPMLKAKSPDSQGSNVPGGCMDSPAIKVEEGQNLVWTKGKGLKIVNQIADPSDSKEGDDSDEDVSIANLSVDASNISGI